MQKITKSKYELASNEQKLCHGIIHSAGVSAAAVGAGLAQLPLADNAVITPIQITMIISLGKVFDQKITKTIAQSLLSGFVANFLGRGVAQAAIGWIPVAGNVTNAVTAAAITESIGWISVDYFYKERYLKKATESDERKQVEKSSDIVKDGEEDKPNIEKEQQQEELTNLANQFIKGEKTRKGNQEDYKQCMDMFDDILYGLPDDDPLRELYSKILDLK